MICTAQPIKKTADGYILLSAGHCVQDTPVDLQFSVADDINGTLHPVTMIKAYDGDGLDFSIFDFKTKKKYPVFEIGNESSLHIGDDTVNVNFGSGMTKQLSFGKVSSTSILKTEDSDDDTVGKFIVQQDAAPGASGSVVISAKSHKIVGVLVYEFKDRIGFGVEPISNLAKFLAGPGQPHPVSEETSVQKGVAIPDDIMQSTFGKDHPFTLTVKGPNPKFTQGGYDFVVDTDGFELSDDYYYNVPVYIDKEDGIYFLVSTKDEVSVPVTPISKAE